MGAISSVGLEHPVYIRRVGGSSPSSPTIFTHLDKNFLTRDVALNCCVASMKQRFARLVSAAPIIIGLARGGVKFPSGNVWQVNSGTKWQVVECLAASALRFRAKTVIAVGGVALAFQEHTEKAPLWMMLVWQKITQKQKLAKVATNKKRDCVGVGNSGGMRS